MTILWIKSTSKGKGHFDKLEQYIEKNICKIIGNTSNNIQHNTCDFVIKKNDIFYNNKKVDLNNIKIAVFIFTNEASVITEECRNYLLNIEHILFHYKHIKIVNKPSSVIKQNSKTYLYSLLEENNIENVPMFKKINTIDKIEHQIEDINYYPVILRKDLLFGGKCMTKCNNKLELVKELNSIENKDNLFIVQFLKSEYKNIQGVLLRVIVINNTIITYYLVNDPNSKWNVHTSTGWDRNSFNILNKDNEELIDESLFKHLIRIMGLGTYAFDCIIHNNKIIILEVNIKISLQKYLIREFNPDLHNFKLFSDDNNRSKLISDALIKDIL
jgi:glutathione synthase/RimK-type ligase-like ATP-grasp enzyme